MSKQESIKNILCFGDSLTWGWVPREDGGPTTRYDYQDRWTGVMARTLGDGFRVIEEGLSARTTSADDPNDPRLNGSLHLPVILASHLPLDLVILMLGTNDTRPVYQRTVSDISYGMMKLVLQVLTEAGGVGTAYPPPKCLLVAPPPMGSMSHPYLQSMYGGGISKSQQLGKEYAALADYLKVDFFDAGECISTCGSDGIHFSLENNADLGTSLAKKVIGIL